MHPTQLYSYYYTHIRYLNRERTGLLFLFILFSFFFISKCTRIFRRHGFFNRLFFLRVSLADAERLLLFLNTGIIIIQARYRDWGWIWVPMLNSDIVGSVQPRNSFMNFISEFGMVWGKGVESCSTDMFCQTGWIKIILSAIGLIVACGEIAFSISLNFGERIIFCLYGCMF